MTPAAERRQPGEAGAAAVLERLGDPDEIVAEQLGRLGVPRLGARTWSAVILLLFGGFLAGAGWLVGVALLWSSRAWTRREKLIGTLLVPGGLAGAIVLAVWPGAGETCYSSGTAVSHCTGVTSTPARLLVIALFVFLFIAPIVTAIFLARRARPLED